MRKLKEAAAEQSCLFVFITTDKDNQFTTQSKGFQQSFFCAGMYLKLQHLKKGHGAASFVLLETSIYILQILAYEI